MKQSNSGGFFQVPNALIHDHAATIGVYGVAVYSVLLTHRNQETGAGKRQKFTKESRGCRNGQTTEDLW